MRYTANLMINLESTIMLPYFFVCLAKVSQLVGCFYFVGGDVGVAVLAVVAVLDILECLAVLDILVVLVYLGCLVVLDILFVLVNLGCLVELVVIDSLAYKPTKNQQFPNTSTHQLTN